MPEGDNFPSEKRNVIAHRFALLLRHPRNPVDAPDFAEHGAVREAEAEGEEPRAEAAGHREDGGTDEAAIEACNSREERSRTSSYRGGRNYCVQDF